jgi:hypothetical protein
LMRFFTDIERESLGVICPRVLATGTSYTSALTGGEERRFRSHFQVVGERCRQRIHDDCKPDSVAVNSRI